MHMSFILIRYF